MDFSDNPAFCNKPIPKERLFDDNSIREYGINEVTWLLSIKPGIRNVQKYVCERTRLEEIEVLSVTMNLLPETGFHIALLKQIQSVIQYPCVVMFRFMDKYKIASWKFIDGALDNSKNVLKTFYISSWIHEPIFTPKTQKAIHGIEKALLYGEGSIKDIYDTVCQYILDCSPQYIGSRSHLQRIIYDLTGNKNDPIIKSIDSTVRYQPKDSTIRYGKREYNTSFFKYAYEYEEVWNALMCTERFRRIIERRNYADAEEMIFRIDQKYEEQDWQ